MILGINSYIDHYSFIQSQMKAIDEEISYLTTFNDIIITVLYRIDGVPIKVHYNKEINPEILILSSWIKEIITKISKELQQGVENVSYLRENYPIIFQSVGKSCTLVALLDPLANTGLLSMEIARTGRRLSDIISQ